jgi:hypothetical protein
MTGTLIIDQEKKDAMLSRAIAKLGLITRSDGVNFNDAFFTYSPRYDLNIWEIDRGEDDEYITWGITAYLYTGTTPPTDAEFVRLGTLTLRKDSE